jgi:hypothetical protein
MLQPFNHPLNSIFISTRLFSVPQVENEVKRNPLCRCCEIQEAITDELKKVQKEEFLAASQILYGHAKACIYANGAYLVYKKSYLSSIFKKISPKTFGPHCVLTF